MAKDILDKVINDVDKELTKNKKETIKVKKENTAPKTVKVSTLIKIGVTIAAIALSFAAGWTSNTAFNNYDKNRVKTEAKALVQDLKSSK